MKPRRPLPPVVLLVALVLLLLLRLLLPGPRFGQEWTAYGASVRKWL